MRKEMYMFSHLARVRHKNQSDRAPYVFALYPSGRIKIKKAIEIFIGMGYHKRMGFHLSFLRRRVVKNVLIWTVGLVALGASPTAQALGVYVDGYGGGMYGTPTLGGILTQKPTGETGAEFFRLNSGGLLGARVGLEVFHVNAYLQFDQFFNAQGASGSVLQPMIGGSFSLGQGNLQGIFGGAIGGVFGFVYTPSFPIDKNQIATRGVAVEVQPGIEYKFNRFLAFQLVGTLGYHYLFDGAIQVDNLGSLQTSNTHGFHMLAKLGLRFGFGS